MPSLRPQLLRAIGSCALAATIALAQGTWAAPPSAPPSPPLTGQGGSVSIYHEQRSATPPANAAQTAQTVQAAKAAGTVEDAAAELERVRAEQRNSWSSLGAMNPLAPGTAAGTGAAGPGGAVSAADPMAGLSGPFAQLGQLLQSPLVQGYLKLFSNPVFARGADQLVQAFKGPKRLRLLYAQIGFILFILVLRAWRFSKSTHWLKRLWTQAWTFLLFWVGTLVIVPWAVLGDPYYNVVAGVLDVVLTAYRK
jgi:hypothetical protein